MNGFEKWFSKATQRFEKALLKLGVALLLLLFITQFMMTNESIRRMLNYGVRLEGPEVEAELVFSPEPAATPKSFFMELALEGDPGEAPVFVLVNQKEEAFFKDGGRVYLQLMEGDMIEIDGHHVKAPVTVRIIAAHSTIKTPLVGHSITAYGTNELLGWVTTE